MVRLLEQKNQLAICSSELCSTRAIWFQWIGQPRLWTWQFPLLTELRCDEQLIELQL